MSLETILRKLSFSKPVVKDGYLTREFIGFLQSQASVGDTDISTAAVSTISPLGNPASFVWNSDAAGVFPAGDPTRDLVLSFIDKDNVIVATRTLRGSLTSASGNISVTAVSVTNTTGFSTIYTLVDDGAMSVRADICLTTSFGTKITGSLAWSTVDLSVAGGSPGAGGSK